MLYRLIGSCAQFHCHLCAELEKIGFKPSKANPDLWMRDAGDHYKYVAKYTDDILIMPKDPKEILDFLGCLSLIVFVQFAYPPESQELGVWEAPFGSWRVG